MSDASGAPPAEGRVVPRVVITGSESSGKTTLAASLAGALHGRWLPEYSRHYAEQAQRPLTAGDVAPIAHGQIAAEDAAIGEWRRVFGSAAHPPPLVQDTDLVSTVVYAEFYYGACPPWIEQAARDRLADLYLLCAPDLPWEADGVRDQPSARGRLHSAFEERLRRYGARVVDVRGTGEARVQRALAGVRGWQAAQADEERGGR